MNPTEPSGEHFRRQQEPALHWAVCGQAVLFLAARATCLTNSAIENNYLMEQREGKEKKASEFPFCCGLVMIFRLSLFHYLLTSPHLHTDIFILMPRV